MTIERLDANDSSVDQLIERREREEMSASLATG